ncbi:MAG: HAMP domain-containing protein, partial [Chloroflexi bacterium]|nr:HAMP domain-containing protein [Chloroflexota bacterium]
MLNVFKNLPIFRRLFLAFFLAVLIPDIIIILMGSIYTQVLNTHGIGSSQTGSLILGTAIALLFSTGIVITLGYIVNVTITQPLRQLVALTRRIRQGETGARVSITGRDEISMVAASMNSMLDNIVQLMQHTERQRDGLQFQVEKLVNEVSVVGEGDLRIQAEVTTDALGVLADSFNYMVEELSNLVVRVKTVANEVEFSATNTSERMTDLVNIADTQIQQIAVAAKQIEQMAQSSHRAAEKVQILEEAANEARYSAYNGLGTVQRTIERMDRINSNVQDTARQALVLEDRSREINEIVDVISGIANSTNRLALDAAIQAAMAGENGKGFRAVADDIRRLAERAKEQAGLITRVVRSVREDMGTTTLSMQETARETSEGATLVQETGTAFEKIYTVVEQQAQEIETIHQAVRILLQSASSVVQIMQGVSNSTQQSSVSTRDVAEHMGLLAQRAEQLLRSVEAFKLREDAALSTPQISTNSAT